jgi:hypothetical protein
VTLPVVAVLSSALVTVEGVAAGTAWRYSAATPATCGVAIDVSLIAFVAVSDVFHDEVMLEPGREEVADDATVRPGAQRYGLPAKPAGKLAVCPPRWVAPSTRHVIVAPDRGG